MSTYIRVGRRVVSVITVFHDHGIAIALGIVVLDDFAFVVPVFGGVKLG